MKLLTNLISLEAAQKLVYDNIAPVERIEMIDIDNALGRVLSEDVLASRDVPPHNWATKDGFAVISRDTSGASPQNPRLLKLEGRVYAGQVQAGGLSSGYCIQVATGARMPEGADAVVAVEDTSLNGDIVSIFKAVSPYENFGFKGENIAAGEIILEKGAWLSSRKIGLLASQGLRQVKVYAKPIITIVPTGEEIADINEIPKEGQIHDVNSYTLSAVVRKSGGVDIKMPVSRDNVEHVRKSLKKALEADMVVTSGGVSVGDKDLITQIVEEWGTVLFHGIRIKPGRPTMFALVEGKPVMGIPGYPTSCFLNAYVLLAPAVRKMAHLPPKRNVIARVRLAGKVSGPKESTRFQLVRLEGEVAFPLKTKPSALLGMAKADGYVVVPEGIEGIEEGSEVDVVLF